MSTDLDTRPGTIDVVETIPAPQLREPGDHDRFAHFVPKKDLDAYWFTGKPLKALCGKEWAPSRDPDAFPVCPDCKQRWEAHKPGDPDDPTGPSHPGLT